MTDSHPLNTDEMIKYLLGEMPEEKKITFEQACLEDDRLFEELLAVEAELTDDYARGELVGRKREAFERRLLSSPGRIEELQLSRLLTRKSGNIVSNDRAIASMRLRGWFDLSRLFVSRPLVGSLAAVALLALAVGLGLLWRNGTRPAQQAQTPTSPGPKIGQSPSQKESPSASKAMVATFVLAGGGERDAGAANDIDVRLGTERIRLIVPLEGQLETHHYTAVTKRVGGETVLTFPNFEATRAGTGNELIMEFPEQSLPLGDYILTVSDVTGRSPEVVGRYFLRRPR